MGLSIARKCFIRSYNRRLSNQEDSFHLEDNNIFLKYVYVFIYVNYLLKNIPVPTT